MFVVECNGKYLQILDYKTLYLHNEQATYLVCTRLQVSKEKSDRQYRRQFRQCICKKTINQANNKPPLKRELHSRERDAKWGTAINWGCFYQKEVNNVTFVYSENQYLQKTEHMQKSSTRVFRHRQGLLHFLFHICVPV